MGNYQIVLSLLSSLDHGREIKRLVDIIIDNCDAVVNLRESVIEHRIKYSVATRDDKQAHTHFDKAVRSLEQYFDLIVFAAYVDSPQGMGSGIRFSSWLKARPEIWKWVPALESLLTHGARSRFSVAAGETASLRSRRPMTSASSRARSTSATAATSTAASQSSKAARSSATSGPSMSSRTAAVSCCAHRG